VAPFFDRFNLHPSELNPDKISLEWLEKGSDAYFNASVLSDGTLRFICMATLLLQPQLPSVILVDEPELGLHPSAIRYWRISCKVRRSGPSIDLDPISNPGEPF